jgi:SAM-dependent methyltransferase
MIAEARRRHPGLCFETCSGKDLAGLATASCDLVIAVDVFPYLVQGGLELAAGMIAEAARVLRPGGELLILNFSYRDVAMDRRDMPAIAAASGFELLLNGRRGFVLWDGAIFRMRRGT